MTKDSSKQGLGDPIVVVLTIGFIVAFLGLSLWNMNAVADLISAGFAWTAQYFGSFFQLLLLLTFIIAILTAFSRYGSARIGSIAEPEISTFRWLSMILCTLLAGGGVFFAAGEPLYHYLIPPPASSAPAKTAEAIAPALAQSFMHWGFLAWAVLGSLSAIVLSYSHYVKGKPLQPRTLLYPVVGEKLLKGWLGSVIDACCVIAVVAGTVGPIGFLATQVSYGLSELFGATNGIALQLTILMVLAAVYMISALTGIHKGIQFLSRMNVYLALIIAAIIIIFGPTLFFANSYLQGLGHYINGFFSIATVTAQTAPGWWMQWWTVFFFAWFIGYTPLMAIFVARISKGRTIREMIISVAIIAPLVTTLWFTLLGGSGIYYQSEGLFDLTASLTNFEFDVATLTVAQALPGGKYMAAAILLLTTVFVATTGDSMSYSIAMVGAGHEQPNRWIRLFWGGAMAVMAAVLLNMGSGQIGVLQQFIVITALPVSLIILPTLWTGPQTAKAMWQQQVTLEQQN
ncbi:BCCT family transporter [Idiomarina seosinensis]|uniref:BCCT family transporter n=1 Tax=Idiomarina seosinensis TaxID=281739 RepID=UPI00384C4021